PLTPHLPSHIRMHLLSTTPFLPHLVCSSFFFNDPAPPAIYTLSLHDALPISPRRGSPQPGSPQPGPPQLSPPTAFPHDRRVRPRSEEHTSELQSRFDLVCRLLLEKKKK